MKCGWLILVVPVVTSGCTVAERDPPGDFSPTPTFSDNELSCDALRAISPEVGNNGRFLFDGGEATCPLSGLECPMGGCDGGTASAKCFAGFWSWRCTSYADAGQVEAGGGMDGGEHADSSDVGAD